MLQACALPSLSLLLLATPPFTLETSLLSQVDFVIHQEKIIISLQSTPVYSSQEKTKRQSFSLLSRLKQCNMH